MDNHVVIFDGTTGKLVKDSSVVAITGVTTSAGAGDSGKATLLNGSGILDTSFLGVTAIAKGGSGQATAVLARAALNVGSTALVDAATITTDGALGNVFTVTLAGNRTLGAPSNLAAGATYIWIFTQGSGGSHTLGYNGVFKFSGGTQPTLSTSAGAIDIITGVTDGTNVYASFVNDLR